ncbi:MAG: hypothetical protein KJ057_11910 [Phycisphaerae bacterium]|nr:hypothetical protein [Phycisphaerae bacterium]MCL4719167.1 hypothetical protein [Phycisphaerae bacterium]
MPVILIVFMAVQESSSSMPVELQRALMNRHSLFTTAVVEWELDSTTPHQSFPVSRFSSQYAGEDYLFVEHPPEDPAVVADRMGKPWAFSEYRKLIKGGGDRWSHVPGSVIGKVQDDSCPDPFHVKDVRSIGLLPGFHEAGSAAELNPIALVSRRLEGTVTYWESTPVSKSVHKVTAHLVDGGRWTWELDPAHDFEPVACESVLPFGESGEFVQRAQTVYEEVDGRRFPAAVEFLAQGVRRSRVNILHAEFDQPHHEQVFSVGEALRMIPGTNIVRGTDQGWSSPRIFDGEQDRAVEDAVALEKSGLLDTREFLSRVIRWESDPKYSLPKSVSDFESQVEVRRSPRLWEEYTRKFIREFDLSRTQTDRAWKHLRSCQKDAYAYLDAQAKAFSDIREQRAKARSTANDAAGPEAQRAEAKAQLSLLDERESALLERIDLIFEKRLKPGFRELLTPAQVEAAAKRASVPSK